MDDSGYILTEGKSSKTNLKGIFFSGTHGILFCNDKLIIYFAKQVCKIILEKFSQMYFYIIIFDK